MERFVRLIVGGGVALVAGLWIVEFAGVRSIPWLAGAAVALVGLSAILAGIATEIRL